MMKHRWMQAVFAPRGVAVLGSCGDPSKLAWGTLRAVLRQGQKKQRTVVAINRHVKNLSCDVSDRRLVFRHPRDIPPDVASTIDLALLVSSHEHCLERMQQCIASFPALQAVNVVSGGFRETAAGGGGAKLELEMVREAQNAGVRLIGPNSVGSIDTYNNFASMFLRTFPKPGGLSLISQSGGLCGSVVELLSYHHPSKMGMSKVLSLGNAADVGFVEALEAVGEDPHTQVILLYLEGLGASDDGDEFVCLAKTIAVDKPIIALKAGTTHAGARAVSSHTGALAGNQHVYSAALRAAGIVQATSLRGMLEMAHALSCRSRVPFSASGAAVPAVDRKYRVAVVTNAGGPAALTVDALVNSGAVTVPHLPQSLQSDIRQRQDVHHLSATSNPIDLLGGATPQGYRSAIEASLDCPDIDAALALHVPMALSRPEDLATEMISSLKKSSKPLVGMLVSSDRDFLDPALSELNSAGSIPTFCHPEGVGEAFRGWKEREDRLFPPDWRVEAHQDCLELSDSQLAQCQKYLSRLGPGWVLEHEARTLLDILSIDQPNAELVPAGSSLKDILAAAEKITYPVVLKRVDHVHKSKAGGVALNLQSSAQVQAAAEKMFPENKDLSSSAPIVVCEYISEEGSGLLSIREFFIGAVRDETFGPAVCFGSGGTLVEVVGDVAFALPPQTRLDTLDLVSRVRLTQSEPPLDVSVMAVAVEKIAALARAFSNIAELDINPLMVGLSKQGETKVLAADVKFRLDTGSKQ